MQGEMYCAECGKVFDDWQLFLYHVPCWESLRGFWALRPVLTLLRRLEGKKYPRPLVELWRVK